MNSVRIDDSRYLNCGRRTNAEGEGYDPLLGCDWTGLMNLYKNECGIRQPGGGFWRGSLRSNADRALCRIGRLRVMVRSECKH